MARKNADSERKTPSWKEATKEEITDVITKLAKEGKTPAVIGQALKEEYGVKDVKKITGKTVSAMLKELKLASEYPADLLDLIKRAVKMRTHIKTNKRDTFNTVKLDHVESRIKRLVRYYRGKKLPKDWAYDPEKAALIVK